MGSEKRAFLVCGPESSGNRLFAGILCSAGCAGSGSTDQDLDALVGEDLLVHIVHHGPAVAAAVWQLRQEGYEVEAVIPVRDATAAEISAVDRGHAATRLEAERKRWDSLSGAVSALHEYSVRAHLVSYENLVADPRGGRERLLQRLEIQDQRLPMMVDRKPVTDIYDANRRRYDDDVPHRITDAKELVWFPARGMGYYPVPNFDAYDDAYWEKYVSHDASETGQALTAARLDLVRAHYMDADLLVDVGIGAGRFLRERGGLTYGYDVNPRAVAWLHDHGKWLNPYRETIPAVTCWDSLEHLPDPAKLLASVTEWAFVSIPIFEDAEHCIKSKHFRRDEHFWYWTEDGLRRWFEGCGFVLVTQDRREEAFGREGILTAVFRRARTPAPS